MNHMVGNIKSIPLFVNVISECHDIITNNKLLAERKSGKLGRRKQLQGTSSKKLRLRFQTKTGYK